MLRQVSSEGMTFEKVPRDDWIPISSRRGYRNYSEYTEPRMGGTTPCGEESSKRLMFPNFVSHRFTPGLVVVMDPRTVFTSGSGLDDLVSFDTHPGC